MLQGSEACAQAVRTRSVVPWTSSRQVIVMPNTTSASGIPAIHSTRKEPGAPHWTRPGHMAGAPRDIRSYGLGAYPIGGYCVGGREGERRVAEDQDHWRRWRELLPYRD
jgi:hypothetical protein